MGEALFRDRDLQSVSMKEIHQMIQTRFQSPLLGRLVVEIRKIDSGDFTAIGLGEKTGRTTNAGTKVQDMAIRS